MSDRMHPEWKRKWIEALRSGQYEQGRSALRFAGEDGCYHYCNLGVLCDISGIGRWRVNRKETCYFNYMGEDTCLPREVREPTGVSHAAQIVLTTMNDRGHSFARIADWIEEHL